MHAARTRLARQGNSTGLTLSREVLEASGLGRGAEVAVEATPGRIVITPAAGPYDQAMEAYDAAVARYGRTLTILSK